jgi:tetratricopeptide (TPR) repeat protein
MLNVESRIEELRQEARARLRRGDYEQALEVYDEALALAGELPDDETRELVTINKADAMIALERTGPEVQELPRVIMRRRNPRHVYLAAYALQYKFRLENDLKRALFYGQLALRTAEEAGEPSWRRIVLLELGNIYELDSQIVQAIECFNESLAIDEESPLLRSKHCRIFRSVSRPTLYSPCSIRERSDWWMPIFSASSTWVSFRCRRNCRILRPTSSNCAGLFMLVSLTFYAIEQ